MYTQLALMKKKNKMEHSFITDNPILKILSIQDFLFSIVF